MASAADWEEIKRLAADFQRAQLSTTIQRLSERNCIEIVQKLIELRLIEVIYTIDGKEYLTPQELVKEIQEELIVRGGRINLVDLQTALNVDFNHIEAKANEIVRNEKNINLVLGQLVDKSYLDALAEEINDKLQEQGQVTLADLAKTYDLPGDFLLEAIEERLGATIIGQIDEVDYNVIYTQAYVERHKAIIRGAFSAITKPTPLSAVIGRYKLQDRLFFTVLEDLQKAGSLAGTLAGGRQEHSQYIPDIYTQSQNEWVDNFYKQNGYLEYDTLIRIGISDPKAYIRKRMKKESLLYLTSCCIGQQIEEQVDAEIDEAITSASWLDIMPLVPSVFTPNDASQLLTKLLRRKTGVSVFSDSIVVSDMLVAACHKPFDTVIEEEATKVAHTNPGLLLPNLDKKSGRVEDEGPSRDDKKEQRRKKATVGKSGGGTQGREVKTKSTKKKTARARDEDSDEEFTGAAGRGRQQDVQFMNMESIEEKLGSLEALRNCPEELVSSLAEKLHRPINKQILDSAKSIFLQTAGGATGADRKKTHGDLAEKIVSLWTNVKLYEKGMKLFGEETQAILCKHLLKTICTDITNQVMSALASEHMVAVQDENALTHETRLKLIGKIPEEKTKDVLSKLEWSVNGKSLEDFVNCLDAVCDREYLDISLRKVDKKKERQLVFHHRQALAEQIRQETDPALVLHLASVILFQLYTQNMVNIPGRAVPQVVTFLKDHMTPEYHQVLRECQDLVVRQLKQQLEKDPDNPSEEDLETTKQLVELVPRIKDLALNTKKGTTSAQAQEDCY